MKRHRSLWFARVMVIGALALFTFVPTSSVLASCAPLTMEQQMRDASVVATGTVTTVSSDGITATLGTLYKGNAQSPVSIVSESPGAISSVDVSYQEGAEYVFFLRASEDGAFTTNTCNGTRNIDVIALTTDEKAVLTTGVSASSTPGASETPATSTQSWPWLPAVFVGAAIVVLGAVMLARTRHATASKQARS